MKSLIITDPDEVILWDLLQNNNNFCVLEFPSIYLDGQNIY